MAEGALLQFPAGKKRQDEVVPQPKKIIATPPGLVMDSYDYEETVTLYEIAKDIKKKGEELVRFMDRNRASVRQAGIEWVTVEISSILEGDKFQRVFDALESSVSQKEPISLTRDGADKVHRLERLVAEADGSIVQYMGTRTELGQASYVKPSSDMSTWLPIVIIGMAGIIGVVAIIALTQQSRK